MVRPSLFTKNRRRKESVKRKHGFTLIRLTNGKQLMRLYTTELTEAILTNFCFAHQTIKGSTQICNSKKKQNSNI